MLCVLLLSCCPSFAVSPVSARPRKKTLLLGRVRAYLRPLSRSLLRALYPTDLTRGSHLIHLRLSCCKICAAIHRLAFEMCRSSYYPEISFVCPSNAAR